MRIRLKNNREVYHYWANQTQSRGECGNTSFEGPRAYSYARNIAMIHENSGASSKLVLFGTRGRSSVTTSAHISYARQAASHMRQISVPDCHPTTRTDHTHNLQDLLEQISKVTATANRARVHKAWHMQHAEQLILDYNDYAEFFGLDERYDPDAMFRLQAKLEAERKKLEREVKEAEERRRVEMLEAVDKWRAGESVSLWGHPDTMIRLAKDGKHVETSHGATITVRTAKRLWPMIKQAHDTKTAVTSAAPFDVDGYPFRSIDANGNLQVGCHFIKYAELERMAHILKLVEGQAA